MFQMKNCQESRILLYFFLTREKDELVWAAKCAKLLEEFSSCQESCKMQTLLITAELLVAFCFFGQKKSHADITDTGFSSSPPACRLQTQQTTLWSWGPVQSDRCWTGQMFAHAQCDCPYFLAATLSSDMKLKWGTAVANTSKSWLLKTPACPSL